MLPALLAALALSPGLAAVAAPPAAALAGRQVGIDPWLLEQTRRRRSADLLVWMKEQADLSAVTRLSGKREKTAEVVRRLREVAARTQAPLLRELAAAGVAYRPFWIANMVALRADPPLLRRLARRADVARLVGDPEIALDRTVGPLPEGRTKALDANLRLLGVRKAFWRRGITGEGVVLGLADTGFDWRHPALRSKYRGAGPGGVEHDHNWFDGAGGQGSPGCRPPFDEPCDDFGHGTRTLGLAIGKDGRANRIGVAPGAKWIGCRNMDAGVGSPSTYSACLQWFLAPTDREGNDPDPSLAPDVVSNSWVCTSGEGCGDPTVLGSAIAAVRAAGIVVVAAAGNDGPGCSSLDKAPAIYDAALTVGSVDVEDHIAETSSRGPVASDGSGRVKPDLVAPGVNVRTSIPGGGYLGANGTSMAAPQVAGMAALLISAEECLRGDVDAIESHLLASAAPIAAAQTCGEVAGEAIPNAVYGWGSLRAARPSCPPGIAGSVDGLALAKLTCRDRSAGGKTSRRLGGGRAWRCDGERFRPEPGDRVRIRILGDAWDGAVLAGEARGVDLNRVTCENRTTGVKASAVLTDEASWNCSASGLAIGLGDRIRVTLAGRAN